MTRVPDFMIVGAMRSGTTALAAALARHPDVFICDPKEPSYFATEHGALDFSGPGDAWFASQNTTTWEEYVRLFEPGESAAVTGEASAMYLALPDTAATIAARLPGVKILVVLREPLARAQSAHAYLRVRGREVEPDFARALALEEKRRSEGYGPIWWFRGASDYAPGLRAFSAAFPRAQMKVITTEALERDAGGAMDDVAAFLGLESHPGPERLLVTERVNAGGEPRYTVLTRALYPPDRWRRSARRMAPEALLRGVRSLRERARVATTPNPVSTEVVDAFRALGTDAGQALGLPVGALWPAGGTSL